MISNQLMFKEIRSTIGKLFSGKSQDVISIFISKFYWFFRKYFLGIEIKKNNKFKQNWKKIIKFSAMDEERCFSLYQLLKIHNEIFKNKKKTSSNLVLERGLLFILYAIF